MAKAKIKPKVKIKKVAKQKVKTTKPSAKPPKSQITKLKKQLLKLSEPTSTQSPPQIPIKPLVPIISSSQQKSGTDSSLDLDNLPLWTDRERLRMLIAEENLSFSSATSSKFLDQSKKKVNEKSTGYFLISASSNNKPVGAIDGYFVEGNILLMRAGCSENFKKSDLFSLLYCAALSKFKPKNVLYQTTNSPLTLESAGLLILLGRSFGMQAIPIEGNNLLFIRRVGKEFDLLANGPELAQTLTQFGALLGNTIKEVVDTLGKKAVLYLIALPNSPDSREHLHEIHDLATSLKIPFDEDVFEKLKTDYVLSRKDITPTFL